MGRAGEVSNSLVGGAREVPNPIVGGAVKVPNPLVGGAGEVPNPLVGGAAQPPNTLPRLTSGDSPPLDHCIGCFSGVSGTSSGDVGVLFCGGVERGKMGVV